MSLIRNERLKLTAEFLNGIGIGLIGIAVLRPIVEDGAPALVLVGWSLAGVVLHRVSHYVLGYLR
ncbi:hypothetical protein [Frigidibacter oleivorans]|uniref:hypothetical protein n=1 Tax=Frigidibacter oleivorans TaxID=2487129 RepID=UPI000F8E120B|nr:hypothetical protein [Frigidibacter oleivorans]